MALMYRSSVNKLHQTVRSIDHQVTLRHTLLLVLSMI